VIAENIYAQCDIEGRQYNMMEGIVENKKDGHVVETADMYINHGSNKKVRKTTKGWHLCVECKDGTTSWERLVDIKEINPVEAAEYAVKLRPLPQPQMRAHISTDKSKRPDSRPTKECDRACVLCLKAEPKYYYCPIT
jgi:hypothetical protein